MSASATIAPERRGAAVLLRQLRVPVMYFGAVGFGWAQLVYSWVSQRFDAVALDFWEVLLLIVILHVGPTAALWLARLALRSWRRVLDVLVFSTTLVSVLRQAQLAYLGSVSGHPLAMQYVLVALAACLALLLVYALRNHATFFLLCLGVLSLVFPIDFAVRYVLRVPIVSASPAPSVSRPQRSVFIFIFDELSLEILLDGNDIDAVQYPNFHRFAGEAVWFRQAMSNYNSTGLSIRSLLSGAFVHRLEENGVSGPLSLGEGNLLGALGRAGYTVNFYSRFLECPAHLARCVPYGSGMEMIRNVSLFVLNHQVPSIVSARLVPWLPAQPNLFEARMLARLADGVYARPAEASVFHFMLSHVPYVLTADGTPVASRDFRSHPSSNVERMLERYRAQVKYLDRQFGVFLDRLERSGAARRSVIILTADHGTCWKPGCMGRLDISVIEPSLVRVPMMIRTPTLPHRVVDGDYQHVDFSPTVLDVLGLTSPAAGPGDGVSAVTATAARRVRWFFLDKDRAVRLGLPPASTEIGQWGERPGVLRMIAPGQPAGEGS